MSEANPFMSLVDEYKRGNMARRDFLRRALDMGVGAPVALYILNHLDSMPPITTSAGAGEPQ